MTFQDVEVPPEHIEYLRPYFRRGIPQDICIDGRDHDRALPGSAPNGVFRKAIDARSLLLDAVRIGRESRHVRDEVGPRDHRDLEVVRALDMGRPSEAITVGLAH